MLFGALTAWEYDSECSISESWQFRCGLTLFTPRYPPCFHAANSEIQWDLCCCSLQGPPGTGKTHTVVGILNTWHLVQYQRYYTSWTRFIRNEAHQLGATGGQLWVS